MKKRGSIPRIEDGAEGLMDFSQSALFFDLSFQFVILHLLISICTQFHHLFSGHPLC